MTASPAPDSDSEYGYDVSTDGEEELLLQLAAGSGAAPPGGGRSEPEPGPVPGTTETVSGDDVRYPNLSQALQRLLGEALRPPTQSQTTETDAMDDDALGRGNDDRRSPIQRFRSYPQKPLSVSDLTSGAWCELQHWYTLTQLPGGRKTQTPAMRQGSKLHRQLEDEVHATVRIDIATREDGFGLRLWNLVQGLRTLRDAGLTRELEVWGMVDGHLVNGIIDSVSYENPNPEFEEELSGQGSEPSRHRAPIADYFPPKPRGAARDSPKVYLADVKTRGTLAPVSQISLRPAKIQLLLYHRFLSDMAAGSLDFSYVFRRYGLDADERFSDSFMSQIGELHDEVFFDTPTSSADRHHHLLHQDEAAALPEPPPPPSGAPDLLQHGSLRALAALVRRELRLAFPLGAASLGHILRVQYVLRDDGRELDTHDFPVSRQALDDYLSRAMRWWRGERNPVGVDIEEAFKCRACEFAESCSWRLGRDAERLRAAQEKIRLRRAAAGGG